VEPACSHSGKLSVDIVDDPATGCSTCRCSANHSRFSREAIEMRSAVREGSFRRAWRAISGGNRPETPRRRMTATPPVRKIRAYLKACRSTRRRAFDLDAGGFLLPGDLEGSDALTLTDGRLDRAPRPGSLSRMMERRRA